MPELEECPICHVTGRCRFHATYKRNIIDFILGRTVYQSISVTRVICESCGHTHAVLPDCIIPYGQYSLFFILRVLAEYFSHWRTVAMLCKIYQITPSMLYYWKNQFISHYSSWMKYLQPQNPPTPFDFLKEICQTELFSKFQSDFFEQFAQSFLQIHVNSAACY